MKNHLFEIQVPLKVEFYDVDSMNIVWHGNYVKYYEQARCILLDKIGYNYREMERSGYIWPIIKLESKYIKSLQYSEPFTIHTALLEYENRIHISYELYNQKQICVNRGSTIQMAVDFQTGKGLLASPQFVIRMVEDFLASNAENQEQIIK